MAKDSILVVEDDVEVAELITSSLQKKENYHVTHASNGREALEQYKINKPVLGYDESAFQCIILDLKMPEMNGMEFLKELRSMEQSTKRTPVIVLSAYEDSEKWLSLTNPKSGAISCYLKKPFRKKTLLETVERALTEDSVYMIEETLEQCHEKITAYLQQKEKKRAKYQKRTDKDKEKKSVLISALYEHHKIFTTTKLFSTNRLVLLMPQEPDPMARESLFLIKTTLTNSLDIDKITIGTTSLVDISRSVIAYIDSLPDESEITVDISTGDKMHTLGLLFAAYARSERISKIVSISEDGKEFITIPKMQYSINLAQKELLKHVKEHPGIKTMELNESQKMSQGMIYKYVNSLLKINALQKKNEGLYLTECGQILIL